MNIRSMTDVEKRAAAKAFIAKWSGQVGEKQNSQKFWFELLTDVFGVEHVTDVLDFEVPVMLDHTSFIDCRIPETHVLIEQKGSNKKLTAPIIQSDGTPLSPTQQAMRYVDAILHQEGRQAVPRWIVTSNFHSFMVIDMDHPRNEAQIIELKDLEKEYHRLNFLIDTGSENLRREMEISKKAGDLVGLLYDALLKKFGLKPSQADLHSLNVLCVRLVFCLYAEDAGLFKRHLLFHDYLKQFQPRQAGKALEELFAILDQTEEERPRFLAESDPILASFPYVNGGLFKGKIDVPPFDDDIFDLLLDEASAGFDWSEISPTIFGAMFESTLNPETRRKGGMHYTSIENIYKVIDPLFLNDLKAELDAIIAEPIARTKTRKLNAFHDKLASLEFLDPAAGSGNFLTESYLSLRRLENRVILEQTGGQIMLGVAINPIKVSITQFHGIEINDFAVTVARTALWIAESQMMKETEDIVHMDLDFLPLKTQANIVEGNALRLDWESVVDKSKLNYIMGNPPFAGQSKREKEQAKEIKEVFVGNPKAGKLDYVAAWYKKAADLIRGTSISVAFVSTNSISQGEQVAILWQELQDMHINFAYRTFIWTSESSDQASVHCVIIGFSAIDEKEKYLFEDNNNRLASHINGYLLDADDIFIKARGVPYDKLLPKMTQGSKPVDGGNLLYTPEQYDSFLNLYPDKGYLLRRYIGSNDYINNKIRYCLWLKGVSPSVYKDIPEIINRIEAVKVTREKSPTPGFRAAASTPAIFAEIRQPDSIFLAVPEVSTERRRYIPIGYLDPSVVPSNTLYVLPNATLFMFGVMTSNIHMAWMRLVGSRMKSDYRYTPAVYNNFPWPSSTEAQRQKVEQTAQGILDARAMFPDCSLATLYNELTMPPELLKAHQQNDMAVLAAYGIKKGDPVYSSESACVAFLMKRYQELVAQKG